MTRLERAEQVLLAAAALLAAWQGLQTACKRPASPDVAT